MSGPDDASDSMHSLSCPLCSLSLPSNHGRHDVLSISRSTLLLPFIRNEISRSESPPPSPSQLLYTVPGTYRTKSYQIPM